MDHNTLIAALYVTIPAILTMVAVLLTAVFPARIQEAPSAAPVRVQCHAVQVNAVKEAAYGMYVRRTEEARATAGYWSRVASTAVSVEQRAKARMYVRMYAERAHDHAKRAHEMMYG